MLDCIAVVGLGLIGGSLAKALKIKAGVKKVIGIDPDESQIDEAIRTGVIDMGYSKPGIFLNECTMVFLCAPVPVCAGLALEISDYTNPDCIITDTASTKGEIDCKISQSNKKIRFVGGHPMAGSERSGFAYSREDMFENAYYIILKNESDIEAVEAVRKIAESIGAIPILTDSLSHDKAVAIVSHVPHVTAAALVNLLDTENDGGLGKNIAAGGFRDITRIASSQPALWRDVTLSNRYAVAEGIDRLVEILLTAKTAIVDLDADRIEEYFKRAKNTRDIISGEREGLLPRKFQIVIQVADRPGVIARISAVLGESNLNIKNINVTHSREDVGGVLVVELYSLEDRNKAIEILEADGFTASLID
ncbi:MAG: prephenate dehydrogenase [Clostridia bacterium]|nr:prephenate dehydrogenase [Clostridia bacterium]MBN2884167.1 prephenate dehydrogenase [Clostridia bacterium]